MTKFTNNKDIKLLVRLQKQGPKEQELLNRSLAYTYLKFQDNNLLIMLSVLIKLISRHSSHFLHLLTLYTIKRLL
jgi:hypothetical protein